MRDVAALLGCAPDHVSIEAARSKIGLEASTKLFWDASNMAGVLTDDGLLLSEMHPIDWHRPSHGRVMRLESIAQQVLCEVRSGTDADFVALPKPNMYAAFVGLLWS